MADDLERAIELARIYEKSSSVEVILDALTYQYTQSCKLGFNIPYRKALEELEHVYFEQEILKYAKNNM